MNPLELRGPEFLFFYAVLIIAAALAVWLLKRGLSSGDDVPPQFGDIDPYLVAQLRGGKEETLRVATLALLDRGLLVRDGELLRAAPGALSQSLRPLERDLLEQLDEPLEGTRLIQRDSLRRRCDALDDQLQRMGLLPTRGQLALWWAVGLGIAAALAGVALWKIVFAWSHGHHNVGGLVALGLVGQVLLFQLLRGRERVTRAGKRALEDLRTLFSGLKDRADDLPAGSRGNEVALLAGVFGLLALGGVSRAHANVLFPKAMLIQQPGASAGWGGGDSSCSSSSCSSSSCSSGSSCSGGGCGGCSSS